jgi:pyrrolidone-carboxylate peptidase
LKPEIVINVGVGSKGSFKIEQVGHNGTYLKVDTIGQLPLNGKCNQKLDLTAELHSKLPLHKFCKSLQEKGWKTELSTDADRFLCDYALTTSLCRNRNSLFFHVPPPNFPYCQAEINQALLDLVEIASLMIDIPLPN